MVASPEIPTENLPLATPLGGMVLTVETLERIRVAAGHVPGRRPVVARGVSVCVEATLTRRAGRPWEVPEPAALRLVPAEAGVRLLRGARGQVRRALRAAVTGWVLEHPLELWAVADQAMAAEQEATQTALAEVLTRREQLRAQWHLALDERRVAVGRQLVGLEVKASRLRTQNNRLTRRRQQLAWLRP